MPEKLDWELVRISVVLVAKEHNPSLVTVDFLKRNNIVPEDWKTQADPISTPMVAHIQFEQNTWTVDSDRCIVAEQYSGTTPQAPTCIWKYVEALPHIPYVAIGLNWGVKVNTQQATSAWLKDHFFSGGAGLGDASAIALSLRLPKKADSARRTLNIKSVEQDPNVLEAHFNFHFHLEGRDSAAEEVEKILSKWSSYQDDFEGYMAEHFAAGRAS